MLDEFNNKRDVLRYANINELHSSYLADIINLGHHDKHTKQLLTFIVLLT